VHFKKAFQTVGNSAQGKSGRQSIWLALIFRFTFEEIKFILYNENNIEDRFFCLT
jgi:hypothetical protein